MSMSTCNEQLKSQLDYEEGSQTALESIGYVSSGTSNLMTEIASFG